MLRMTSRLHVTNQTAAPSTGCPKGPGIESRWQVKEKRQGMALGEERQEGRGGSEGKETAKQNRSHAGWGSRGSL